MLTGSSGLDDESSLSKKRLCWGNKWLNEVYTQTFTQKEKRIKAGSKEDEKSGAKGRPTAKQFKRAAKTAKRR